MTEGPASGASGKRPFLKLLTGDFAGYTFEFTLNECLIGRAPENDLVLKDLGVSRVHARVTWGLDGAVYLVDLGSSQGTYVGGLKVDSCLLEEGDLIALGNNTRLKFGYLDAREEKAELQLRREASRDSLTGALNAAAFTEQFHQEAELSRRRREDLSLALLDLDSFHLVNFHWGHMAGDSVLVEFARRARAAIRSRDLLGRLGGQKFGLLLPECSKRPACEILERVRQATRAPFWVVTPAGRQLIEVTVSAGVATSESLQAVTDQQLMAQAEEALLKAKRAGRNRVMAHGGRPETEADPVPLEQKRKSTRVEYRRALSCRMGGRTFGAWLQDIGVGGIRMEVPHRLRVGALVEVEPAGGGPGVLAQVQWCRKKRKEDRLEAGLAYRDSLPNLDRSWVKDTLMQLGLERDTRERRSHLRAPAGLAAFVSTPSGSGRCLVVDLGLGGAMLACPVEVQVGSSVQVRIEPLGPLAAFEANGKVVRCHLKAPGPFLLGVAFESLSAEMADLVGRYLSVLLSRSGV